MVAVERQSHQRPDEDEREEGRPAEQAILAVHEQGHEPVGAVGVARREGGVGGGLAGVVGGVGGGAAVDRLVDGDVEDPAEERHLHRPHREGTPARACADDDQQRDRGRFGIEDGLSASEWAFHPSQSLFTLHRVLPDPPSNSAHERMAHAACWCRRDSSRRSAGRQLACDADRSAWLFHSVLPSAVTTSSGRVRQAKPRLLAVAAPEGCSSLSIATLRPQPDHAIAGPERCQRRSRSTCAFH